MKTLVRFTLALAIALFTASVPAATRIWDGGGANGLWTNAANWSNNIAPANGDALVFPSGVTRLLTTNTPGGATNFSSFTLTGDDYVLVSSTLSLTNGLTCAGGGIFGGVNTLRAPVRLAGQQTWDVAARKVLVVQSNIGLTGVTLTLAGGGGVEVNGSFFGGATGNLVKGGPGRLELNGGNNVFNQLRVDRGTLVVDGAVSANGISISNGVVLAGAGTLSAFTNGGSLRIGTNTGTATGQLTVSAPGSAVFLPGSSMQVQLFGLTPGAGHDQLRVAVPPDLTHGALSVVRSAAFPLGVGQRFVIITNTGGAGFSTSFTNLPQGAFITNALPPATVFQISYTGGNGNDVELTVIDVEPAATGFTRLWDGGGANGFWQTPGNWTNDLAPIQGDRLEFTGNSQRVNTNNFAPGTLFDVITLKGGSSFTLRGNSVRLLSGLNSPIGAAEHILELPVELATNQTWRVDGDELILGGSLSGGSAVTLTKEGPGLLHFSGGQPNIFAGTLTIRGGSGLLVTKPEGVPAVAGPLVVAADERPALAQIATSGQFSNSPPVTIISSTNRLATVVFGGNTGPNRIGALTLDGAVCEVRSGASLELQGDLNTGNAAPSLFALSFRPGDVAAPKLVVSGNVNLQAARLALTTEALAPGISLVILRKDGAAPLNSAFLGLPEGALLTNAPHVFQISYAGGDGNDVVLTATTNVVSSGITRVWDGGGLSGFWRTSANWVNDTRPQATDGLEFAGTRRRANTNDFLEGTTFATLAFTDTNSFTLSGNSLRLLNGLRTAAGAPDIFLNLPMELSASQTWRVDGTLLVVRGSVSAGSTVTWTKDGAGELEFAGASPNRFNGALVVRGSRLTLNKSGGVPAVSGPLVLQSTDRAAFTQVLTSGQFTNSPSVTLISAPGQVANMVFTSAAGASRLGTLALHAARCEVRADAALHIQGDLNVQTTPTNFLVLTFSQADAAVPKLIVSGTVNLDGTRLTLSASTVDAGVPLIVVRHDGTGPVLGTFAGLPEGATVVSGARTFRISYVGGNGNDVVLLPSVTPATISGLASLPSGGTQITGVCLPGLSYVLEATTNLNPPLVWLPLLTNSANSAGEYQFIDPASTNFPARFYRVKSQ